jgi:uncharacterized repeat protein (TIGR03943 family)
MKKSSVISITDWIDVLTLFAWGVLMLKYWLDGTLNLLIHPNYFALVVATAIALFLIGGVKSMMLFIKSRHLDSQGNQNTDFQHTTLLPVGWSTGILLFTAILGLIITPKVFTSYTAINRGITESLTVTRLNPTEFRTNVRSDQKSLLDWIRTLNVYPEPDAYQGQSAKITGFVVYPPELGSEYILLSRFVITCCAADAYPVALPVKINGDSLPGGDRTQYKVDSWFEVSGKMITETLNSKRQLVLLASKLEPIPTPRNPYEY